MKIKIIKSSFWLSLDIIFKDRKYFIAVGRGLFYNKPKLKIVEYRKRKGLFLVYKTILMINFI